MYRTFTAICVAAIAFLGQVAAADPTFQIIHDFNGSDGEFPISPLSIGPDGALYGTTYFGGSEACDLGCGTVFKLTPPSTAGGIWTKAELYRFAGGADGYSPWGRLTFDSSGTLYGTTVAGGFGCDGFGCGTVFKLTPSADGPWTKTVLYEFTGGADGGFPKAGVIFDSSGVLYGTADGGGIVWGTVFKLSPPSNSAGPWTQAVLHSFGGGSDGANPHMGGLIFDSAGALYGTTWRGGSGGCNHGCGTVFKLTPPSTGSGWTETILYRFNGPDGAAPFGGVSFDSSSGALYGTTAFGGSGTCVGLPNSTNNPGCGTIFKLAPPSEPEGAWTQSVLYSFTGGSDGASPYGGVTVDASEVLYGTAAFGGNSACSSGCGTVFKLEPPSVSNGAWTQTVLHGFSDNDGANPNCGLTFDASGVPYGAAARGGTYNAGVLFTLGEPVPALLCDGTPGVANCQGQCVSNLAQSNGGLKAAAVALGYSTVQALKDAVTQYCLQQ